VIELGILGSLMLRLDGEEVRLGPSLRMLVLALLCARGASVPVGRLGVLLAEPDGKPVSGATVRSHVSHLRKVIGEGHGYGQEPKVLVSARVGGAVAYALRHEVVDTDAARFDQKVDEGEAELLDRKYASAGGVLNEALSLWWGAPLADAGGRPYARDWVAHLQDRHRHAVVLRAAASVGGLEHARVAGELHGMVARWPALAQTMQPYTYASGNPVLLIDPNGMCSWWNGCEEVAWGAGAIVGTVCFIWVKAVNICAALGAGVIGLISYLWGNRHVTWSGALWAFIGPVIGAYVMVSIFGGIALVMGRVLEWYGAGAASQRAYQFGKDVIMNWSGKHTKMSIGTWFKKLL
jgi:hypothetical protein